MKMATTRKVTFEVRETPINREEMIYVVFSEYGVEIKAVFAPYKMDCETAILEWINHSQIVVKQS